MHAHSVFLGWSPVAFLEVCFWDSLVWGISVIYGFFAKGLFWIAPFSSNKNFYNSLHIIILLPYHIPVANSLTLKPCLSMLQSSTKMGAEDYFCISLHNSFFNCQDTGQDRPTLLASSAWGNMFRWEAFSICSIPNINVKYFLKAFKNDNISIKDMGEVQASL